VTVSGEFEATLQGMKEVREQVRAMREALEATLAMDPAAVLAGPPPEAMVAAEDATEAPPAPRAAHPGWGEAFARNWPDGPRQNPGWTGRRRR
jgi:hypothetical protein